MSAEMLLPWLALLALGAVHGVNPGMGWLFAVALGMQEEGRRAVWRALPPLALGHAAAIAGAVAAASVLGLALPTAQLKWIVAAALLSLGVYRLVRHRHPRWRGMRVGARDLTVWSLLMATAHGAGLMALPFVLGASDASGGSPAGVSAGHSGHGVLSAGMSSSLSVRVLATLVHAAGYLLVTALLAVIVYEKVGVSVLRRVWVNLDLVWAIALIITALVTPWV